MTLFFSKPGISRLVFLALVLAFNWPLLTIPTGEYLLYWLFSAWALAIAILFAVTRKTASTAAASMADGPPAAASVAEPAGLDQPANPGAYGDSSDAADMADASGAAKPGGRDV